MRIIKTHELTPTSLKTEAEKLWVYNGTDCLITHEVLDVLLPQLDNQTGSTYAFSRELQAPVLDMRLRGVKIDLERKNRLVSDYREQIAQLETDIERIVIDGLGFYGFNWRSNPSLMELFYGRLQIPIIKKKGRPTVNREALEKMESYFIARPIISHLIALREIAKKIGVLTTEIDRDGRMRTSYSIGGTSTGRFSSTFSEFGTGTNLQNIEEELRAIFIADEGMKMAYLDEPQGESRVVGAIEWNLFHDGAYLDACESSDLHTTVAKLCWPGLPWTGDNKTDRKIAEQPFYRHFDYRFMCKKIGHGTNYFGKPYTLSRQAKIDQRAIEDFQPKYFSAFPAHSMWHAWVREQLHSYGVLTTLTGRRRHFFGRRDDDSTFREAVAYDPQGSLADILNRGMLAVWRANRCQLLMQIHDAILIQYPESQEDDVIAQVLSDLTQSVELKHNRTLTLIPDVMTGWNWGKASEANPDGLKAWVPGDQRRRTEKVSILDRKLPRLYKRA